jgi:hypothetical protein
MKLHPVSRLKKSRENSCASLGVRLGLSALLSLVLLTFTARPVHAFKDEPWSKDYKSWTNEDVQKILYESPWVKMVEMGAPWLKGPTHFLTPLPMDCNGRPDMTKDRTPASWAMATRSRS